MLKPIYPKFHKVRSGQTLRAIAYFYGCSEKAFVERNALTAPPTVGQILEVPEQKGNAYTVQGNEDETLLCGDRERYETLNGKGAPYPGKRVFLSP